MANSILGAALAHLVTRTMRTSNLLAAGLLALALLPPPAAAVGSGCGGGWAAPGNACTFTCDAPNLNVLGNAGAPNLATLTITAECYLVVAGSVTYVGGVTCTNTAPVATACGATAFSPAFALNLVGVCKVTGAQVGSYRCWTSV